MSQRRLGLKVRARIRGPVLVGDLARPDLLGGKEDARAAARDQFHVLDVRQPNEWVGAHIPDAHFVTGAELPDRVREVPDDRPVAVVCGSGYRSSASGSLLKHAGRENIINVIGGMGAWNSAGYETKEEDL